MADKMKTLSTISLLVGLILTQSAFSQPARGWVYYDMQAPGGFYDIYACANGDLIGCGFNIEHCVTRVSSEGDEIWASEVAQGEAGYTFSIVEADNGDFVVGGNFGQQFTAFRLSSDGELIWRRDYCQGACLSVIELKDGTFALAGYSPNAVSHSRLIIINGAGEPLRDRTYDPLNRSQFNAMREVDGGIVIAGRYYTNTIYPFMMKIDENGDEEWIADYGQQYMSAESYNGLVSLRGGGFGLLVMSNQNGMNSPTVLKVVDRGRIEWATTIQGIDIWYMPSLCNIPDVGFLIGGGLRADGAGAFAICIDEQGDEIWRSNYNRNMGEGCDPSNIRGIVKGADGFAYAGGDALSHGNGSARGMIFRLGRFNWDPDVFFWEPLDTTLTVLYGDELTFKVIARNPFGGDVAYGWVLGDSLQVGGDSTFTCSFDSLGVFNVDCRVLAGQRSANVHWEVTVSELFITHWTPDTLNLSLVGGSFETFSIDSFRIYEWENVGYTWTLTDLDNMDRSEVSTDFNVDLEFPRGGDFALTGLIYSGHNHDQVIWNIEVRSTIHSYWPELEELSVPCDSSLSFLLIPTNADSGVTHYSWRVGNELLELDATEVTFQFPEVGYCSVYGIARVGDEVDSIRWGVTVLPPDDVASRTNQTLSTSLEVSAFPNPFNSSTTINYSLPRPGRYAIDIIDIQGRLVTRLSDGWREAGSYREALNGDGLPNGRFLVRLNDGSNSLTNPITVLK